MRRIRLITSYALLLHGALASTSSHSEASTTDQICDPQDSLDCYPATFIPRTTFQPIREGQAIPAGLHVRLNVQTGAKEARLNVPFEHEDEHTAGVVVVDTTLAELAEPLSPHESGEGEDGSREVIDKDDARETGPDTQSEGWWQRIRHAWRVGEQGEDYREEI